MSSYNSRISFLLLVNKQGQTRLASYYDWQSVDNRTALEGEIIRRCITRPPEVCQILEYRGYTIVYRRYASLFFIVGLTGKHHNELGVLELIHCLVECLDKYFESVCELDIMFNLDRAHMILDEMVSGGIIYNMNKIEMLGTLGLMDKASSDKPN